MIPPRSKKRAKQEREYSKVRKKFLEENPHCAVHDGEWSQENGNFLFEPCLATEVHHQKGKIGALLTDTRYFLPVCRVAHDYIEKHPLEAKEKGYSLSRLGKD